jgi:hypothetical protein
MKLLDHVGVHGADVNVKRSTFLLCVVVELTFWELLQRSSLPLIVQLAPLTISFAFFLFTAIIEIVVLKESANRDWAAFVQQNSGFGSSSRARVIRWRMGA